MPTAGIANEYAIILVRIEAWGGLWQKDERLVQKSVIVNECVETMKRGKSVMDDEAAGARRQRGCFRRAEKLSR